MVSAKVKILNPTGLHLRPAVSCALWQLIISLQLHLNIQKEVQM